MEKDKPKVGIIISTIREGRFGDKPAHWLVQRASQRTDLHFEIIDLREYPLPLFGDSNAQPPDTSAKLDVVSRWQRKIEELDGYIFITAEYNHSIPGVLKNALDYAYTEFNKKPAAFVGYGNVGSARAIEQLRLICIEFQVAPTRTAVHIGSEPYRGVTREGKQLDSFEYLNNSADAMLEELAWWTHTLKAGRVSSMSA